MNLREFGLFGQSRLTASNGAVCLDKIRFSEEKSGFVWTNFLTFTHIRDEIDPAKQYLVQLEYTKNRQVIRKGINIFVRLGDWNENANEGRGGVRASYGPETNRVDLDWELFPD